MRDPQPQSGLQAHDILAAFSLLTRLPLPVNHARAGARAAVATWAYPLVGATLGLLAGAIGSLAILAGVPNGMAAALALAVLVLASGGLHEDGLADCADGLGGGRDTPHRLEIMKDSRIGAYGAVALGLALIARWSGIDSLPLGSLIWAMAAVGAVSRVPMVLAMYFMQNARASGLSASVGRPPPESVLIALVLAGLISAAGPGLTGIWALLWALLAALPVLMLANRRIGGQTGDVLGATQQCAEIAALATLSALL
jgi:adenosylcobinamide-GDP ribazoletransferase